MGITSTLHTAGAPARAVWAGAGAVVERLDRVLGGIEQLATSIKAIEDDMRGLRRDVQGVNAGIEGLQRTVSQLEGSVGTVREATVSLDHKVDGVEDTLRHIDALTRSIPRLGRRAREGREARIVPQP